MPKKCAKVYYCLQGNELRQCPVPKTCSPPPKCPAPCPPRCPPPMSPACFMIYPPPCPPPCPPLCPPPCPPPCAVPCPVYVPYECKRMKLESKEPLICYNSVLEIRKTSEKKYVAADRALPTPGVCYLLQGCEHPFIPTPILPPCPPQPPQPYCNVAPYCCPKLSC